MLLLNEKELIEEQYLLDESISIQWNVFSKFMQNPDETEGLLDAMKDARSKFKNLSDEEFYKERNEASRIITLVCRAILDIDGAVYLPMAILTCGSSLIAYLLTRLLRLAVDNYYHNSVVSDAKDVVKKLEALKVKKPHMRSEIDSYINRIESNY